jgi:hypothetical protein
MKEQNDIQGQNENGLEDDGQRSVIATSGWHPLLCAGAAAAILYDPRTIHIEGDYSQIAQPA